MKYGIVVDSGCDLKEITSTKGNIDFTRVPLTINVGEKSFSDDLSLDVKHFIDEVYAYKGKTGSAAPSPQSYLEAFEKSDNVFVLTITGTSSGSYASANVAKEMFEQKYPDRNIHLIDTKSTGPEMTLLVYKIIEYANKGFSFDVMVPKITRYFEQTNLLFVLQSLENLMKNGRVSKLQGSLATVLGIKLLGAASEEGTLEVIQKVRGKYNAYDKLVEELVAMHYKGSKIVIAHCYNEPIVTYLEDKIREKFPECEIETMLTSGLCSYYAERGGILVGFDTL